MELFRSPRAILLVIIGPALMAGAVQAQIAIGPTAGATPNPNAMLDLQGVTFGLLAPRMSASQRLAISPAVAQSGLLVFQTDSVAGTNPSGNNPIGYYYYDGLTTPTPAGWRHISGESAWTVGGNAGTDPAVNFIGTTNAQPIRFVTHGLERMRLYDTGRLSVSTTVVAPSEAVEVNGGIRVGNTTGAHEGTIRFNTTTQHFEGYVNNGAASGWVQMDNTFRTRDNQPYIPVGTAPCTYSDGVAGNGAVTTWPLIDNAGFSNTNIANTTESPYSTLWEDGRHQYLYTAAELAALNICANEPIRGIAFQTVGGGGYPTANLYKISMKNTLATSVANFDVGGLTLCYSNQSYTILSSQWNAHSFVAPTIGVSTFLWAGAPYNLLIEACHDNQDWTSGWTVAGETTNFQANFGLFCDACGIQIGSTCLFSTCPTLATAPGTPSATGSQCNGWGHTGGCSLTTSNQLWTCDGTFQWQGGFAGSTRRPLLRINAKTQGGPGGTAYGQYIYSEHGIMVGSAAWAAAGPPLGQNFKGPGTISAEKAVFGGGVLLSDHVFDRYYDNTVRPEDAQAAMGYQHYPIREMANYVERERHLPTIAGREQWQQNGAFSTDQLTTQLWVTVEEQSLYIQELNARMEALQQFLVEKRLKELKEQAATTLKKD